MFESGIVASKKREETVIPTIKPRSNDQIIEKIRVAEKAHAFAVASDIDASTLINMHIFGQPVGPKSASDIAELVKSTSLPFIVKGIMSPEEAVACADAGAKASSSATTAAVSSTVWSVRPTSCRKSPRP